MRAAEIMTLEGLAGSRSRHTRSCLAAARNRAGNCQCARYGAPGEGRDFKTLCKTAGIPMKIGRTNIEGFGASDEEMAPPPFPVEYPPIEDLGEGWGALIPTGEELKGAMTAAGTAAAGILGISFIAPMIPVNPWIKIFGTAILGVLGGNMLARTNRDAGAGLAAGLTGFAFAQAIVKLSGDKLTIGLGDSEADVRRELTGIGVLPEEAELRMLPEDTDIPGRGMEQVDTDVERRLSEAVGVETEQKLGGGWDEAVGVETEQKLGWIGG